MERLPVHIITVTEIKTVAMQSRGLINVIKKKKKTAFVHNFVTCTNFHGKGPNAFNAIQG